ncbi:LPS export ABC transporter periplasmic protein LptC [Flavobacterium nackdongense]|uniref:LPS export ABC transporter periplasmic protein LptC n=1 Tax=Flavobacterium nackdongense TaxID=2547394 RepID=A0A4P6Y812_9FLAO|nr:LPS export ABC transporter periplasmic protein LptC [Flavobacterium nackdongense]QBN18889.1 LPS export ABC transporter periplasmic protein LptC [Flavobacterium nackdongense]
MNLQKTKTILFLLSGIAGWIVWGCESNFKEIQKSNLSEFVPSGEAEKINLKYTDSGRITAILVSPKMMEFANVDFPFTDFPKGIDVTLYDKNNKRTIILADYATSYKLTNIIDLKGNVKITSQDGQILETDQLFFDQKNEWFFTEKSFKFTDAKGSSKGQGIDFSKDFKVINSQKIAGEIESDE